MAILNLIFLLTLFDSKFETVASHTTSSNRLILLDFQWPFFPDCICRHYSTVNSGFLFLIEKNEFF